MNKEIEETLRKIAIGDICGEVTVSEYEGGIEQLLKDQKDRLTVPETGIPVTPTEALKSSVYGD